MYQWNKSIPLSVITIENLKNSKVSYIFNKAIILSITYSIVVVTTVQNLKEKNLLRYEKFLVQWKI